MRKLARLFIAASLLFPAWAGEAAAIASNAGTSSSQFLKLGSGSRAGAMGEAYSAVGDDADAAYYNPASITRITRSQISASHTELFQDINYDHLAFAYPWAVEEAYAKHALALSVYTVSIRGIERRAGGTLEPTGNFNAGDSAYNVSYGRFLNRSVRLGVTGKLISQSIDSYNSTTFAVDGGVLYEPRPDMERRLALSLVLRNLGKGSKFAGETDPLPLAVVAGVGYDILPKRFKVDLDVTKYRDTNAFFAFGGEYTHRLDEAMAAAMRFGVNTHRTDNPGLTEVTAGAGLRYNRLMFDFSWVPYGDLGNSFRYSVRIDF